VVISYSEPQRHRLGLTEFRPDVSEWWVRAHDLSGERVWVPAAVVYAPFPDVPDWLEEGFMTSNAAAAHVELDKAVENAWLELVERDCFQRLRAAEESPEQVDLRTVPSDVAPIANLCRRDADLVLLHAATARGVSVLIAVASNTAGVAIGMAAARSSAAAARKALIETHAQLCRPFEFDPDVAMKIAAHLGRTCAKPLS